MGTNVQHVAFDVVKLSFGILGMSGRDFLYGVGLVLSALWGEGHCTYKEGVCVRKRGR